MQPLSLKRLCTGVAAMALTWLPAMAALANGAHQEDGFGGHHGMMGWGGFMLGPIMMILVVAVVVALVVMLLRWLGMVPQGTSDTSRRNALDILEERFARGEIDSQEFEERRRALGD